MGLRSFIPWDRYHGGSKERNNQSTKKCGIVESPPKIRVDPKALQKRESRFLSSFIDENEFAVERGEEGRNEAHRRRTRTKIDTSSRRQRHKGESRGLSRDRRGGVGSGQ